MAWARWRVLAGVLGVTFGHGCLRAIAMGDPPISRLTLVPRFREPQEGRGMPRELEVRVAAPESARAVTVALPSGEVLSTRYDAERGVWSLHFFVEAPASGSCVLGVSVLGARRAAEGLQLPCSTSPDSPVVRISVERAGARDDDLAITARAIVVAEGRMPSGIAASVMECARHVEVRTPDARLVILGAVRDGVFRGRWRPGSLPMDRFRVRVVSVDRALDERTSEVDLPLPPVVTADDTRVFAVARYP